MLSNVNGDNSDVESIPMFFRLTIGGLLLGFLFSVALGIVLNKIINDEL